jgi:hypothetical protein
MKNETKLALGAAFNATAFSDEQWNCPDCDFEKMIQMNIEDYYIYNPKEANQFDKEVVVKDIASANAVELRQTLQDIGFTRVGLPGDSRTEIELDGDKWADFINKCLENRSESATKTAQE